GGIKLAGRACIDVTFYCLPQTLEEAKGTGHAGIAPFHALLRWSGKHGEEAYGIRAVFPDQLFRVYGVAFGFTHLGAVFQHHALTEQAFEGLITADQPFIAHQSMEETGV